MKIYKYLFLLVGLSIIGCSDLEEEPIGVLSPDGFFQSTQDIQTAVNGSLTHAINEKFWGRKLSIALMLRSDMVNLQSTQTRRVEMNELTTLGDNGMLTEYWLKSYQGIAAANVAIDGAAQVDIDDETKNPVTAQAYFARAFYYFHLVRQFGGLPLILEPITDADYSASIARTSADEVYAQIISDLEFAETWLPNTQASAGIPSKAAAKSYLALVYLTRGEYEDAYTYATDVINNKADYNLGLDPDFQTLFNAEKIDNSIEPIFALDYNNVEADDNAYDQIAPMVGIRGDEIVGGWSVAVPTIEVYESFTEGDYRRTVSFKESALINGNLEPYTNYTVSGHEHAANVPYIDKYGRFPGEFARSSTRATSHNYSMMRYAEVLLIAAESALETGKSGALGWVNEIRERARQGGSTITGDGTAIVVPYSDVPADLTSVTVADVLEERRIELAFECKRWYDIARRQLGDDVYGENGYEGAKPNFDANDYLLPIPSEEIDRNPNLTQNPGY